jgi:hypothetical protein
VANSQNRPDVESLQKRHYEWLLQTGQARCLNKLFIKFTMPINMFDKNAIQVNLSM